MDKKIIPYYQAEQFLNNNFSSPTHWPDWNILVSRYYNTNFYYWGYFKGSELIGIYPVHEIKYKLILKKSHSGQFHLIPHGGWIFSRPVKVHKKYFNTSRNLLTQNTTFSLPMIEEFNANYDNFKPTLKKTLILNLERSEEEIWNRCVHSKRRNMIRKAEKERVNIIELKLSNELEKFYDLYKEASQRFSAHQLSLDFFKDMFFENKNIQLHLYAAYKDQKQLANVAIVSDKNYSFYWLGNNAKGVENIGQGELLQWYAIRKMKEKNCKYYDLCYIEPEKLPHIYKFKKGFSRDERKVQIINNKPLNFRILNKIF